MDDCSFCSIIAGEAASHIVYEDDTVLAILDHRPVRVGHAMVLPKQHIDYMINVPDPLAAHLVQVANKIGRQMMDVLEPTPLRIGHVVHGYFPHVHYHVIPLYGEDDITSQAYVDYDDTGRVVFNAERIPLAVDEDQKKVVALLQLDSG